MKTTLSLLLCLIGLSQAFAQKSDSTRTHYRIIRGGLIEHSTELKSKRYVKNGESEITANKKVVAKGLYKDDKRVGRWQFFNYNDAAVEQVYNYTTNKLEYNSPSKEISYAIDSLKEGDKVVYPAKIGGYICGLSFLLQHFDVPYEIKKFEASYKLYFIFSIDTEGKLTKHQVKFENENYSNIQEIDLKKFKPQDFEFTPAKLNGKNVPSLLIYEGKFNVHR